MAGHRAGLFAEIAQSVEHSTENAGVPSSSLGLGTFSRHRGSGVEQLTRNEQVVSSNLTGGSLKPSARTVFLLFKRCSLKKI